MFGKCNKKCKCTECEYYRGETTMRIYDEDKSGLFEDIFYYRAGQSCGNGYRIAPNLKELKKGYEEDDYVFRNSKIQYRK